jgi:hypothetical protein
VYVVTMLTHVDACVAKTWNIVSMCAVSPVVHTSNISSCLSFPVAVNNCYCNKYL